VAICVSLWTITATETSLAVVKLSEVSSTNASISRVCRSFESGDPNVTRSDIVLSIVFMMITTNDSHAAGDAPLPWPVPNSGSSFVPE
jgi:hypothetical protein